MTEEEARMHLSGNVPRETFLKLERFVDILLDAARNQNLISAASQEHVWVRHVLDSAQLLDHAPTTGKWLDLGSGAGLPGMIVGIIREQDVTLVEMRAKRVAFLRDVIIDLELEDHVSVHAGRTETFAGVPFEMISARAYAPLERLLESAAHLAMPETRWILPKGRSARVELEVAERTWQGDFTIAPSITDPDAAIILAQNVRPRAGVHKIGSRR